MRYSTKGFDNYNIPISYRDVIEGYYKDARRILCENMIMFMLTSSCSLNACIEGWSDIDILVIVEQLDFTELKALHEEALKYDINIALAILSRKEVINKMFDDKTGVVFYQLTTGMITPNYIKSDLLEEIPQVDLEEIKHNDVLMLPWYLHKLRRLLFAPSDDKRAIIKMLYIVIKMKLRMNNVIVISYTEAYGKFAKKYGMESVDIISEMLGEQKLSDGFIKFARQIVEKICNGEI